MKTSILMVPVKYTLVCHIHTGCTWPHTTLSCVLIGKSHPNLKEVINQLQPESSGTAARWYDIGIQLLGDNCAVLEVIKSNYGGDVNSCCREMLRKWLVVQPNAGWNQLVEALNSIGMKSVADKIKRGKIEGEYLYRKSVCI